LALTSPKSGGHSVSIVRSRTQATEFSFSVLAWLRPHFAARLAQRSQSCDRRPVRFGVESPSGDSRIFAVFMSWDALPDERTCLYLLAKFAVTLGSNSLRTHIHILLSHLRILGSHFVGPCGCQGYGGGIVTCLHTAQPSQSPRNVPQGMNTAIWTMIPVHASSGEFHVSETDSPQESK
jgi:hypothetical protein